MELNGGPAFDLLAHRVRCIGRLFQTDNSSGPRNLSRRTDEDCRTLDALRSGSGADRHRGGLLIRQQRIGSAHDRPHSLYLIVAGSISRMAKV